MSRVLGLSAWPDTMCPECGGSNFYLDAVPADPSRYVRRCWCGVEVTISASDPAAQAALRRAAARL